LRAPFLSHPFSTNTSDAQIRKTTPLNSILASQNKKRLRLNRTRNTTNSKSKFENSNCFVPPMGSVNYWSSESGLFTLVCKYPLS
jgi:hypothetical protein